MKYQMLWISSKDNQAYSNYAKDRRELKRKLDYFVNVKGLKLNDKDRLDNIQVSKRVGKKYLILTENEVLDEVAYC